MDFRFYYVHYEAVDDFNKGADTIQFIMQWRLQEWMTGKQREIVTVIQVRESSG